MSKLTNIHGIPLSVAVWLANDNYDYNPQENYISATGLLKPLKSLVLGWRVDPESEPTDISNLVASRIGNAIHDAIEKAWVTNYVKSLLTLGFTENTAKRIVINPEDTSTLTPEMIPVYLEQRRVREINGYKIGGKFDFLSEGRLEDFKSTKTYSYIKDSNSDGYIKQASIYRWLNQDRVTHDTFQINYIFTDWMRSKADQDPSYPQKQIIGKVYPLMSIEDTERFILDKLDAFRKYKDLDESLIPMCSDEELWRDEPVYKYYKDPTKTARSTKNFDDIVEAQMYQSTQGGVGIIKTVPGNVRRCNYCPAFSICKQKDAYLEAGLLSTF